ncbi:CocE/NonD family hydrolase [Ktedonosporobacter rubrisoli]|uniref:CocE/NonD family hydrolase n=1 Tax=Ktedonosporobacter rubrisoli TaxID=2509675 RepID=A0A4P6JLB5_KTERU|nr:CocE/NonD family hydrolase [Ktedonosporobacter rubrisoli]QBD75975.1 CocE/NonD family hydrolase [Ktedonosporobacter rubrisoli]
MNSDLRIAFDQRVPVRDGITLSADIYFPLGEEQRRPVVLYRTPYVKANMAVYQRALPFVKHGYVFVAMDVRGRGDSDGEFTPYVNDAQDGYDTIEWLAIQPWSSGAIGTIGSSYPGRIQWLTALLTPPHLKAMIVGVSPSDPFVETPTGLPSPMHLCWLHLVSGRMNQPMETVSWSQVYEHLPLLTMDERAGRYNQHWRADFEHTQLDEYWERERYQNKFDRINVPVLHISGWYDDEEIGTPLNFNGMTTQGATPEVRASQRMLMGPWGHQFNTTAKLGEIDFGPDALIDMNGEYTSWFDRWLKPTEAGTSASQRATARIFIMGENTWRDEYEWPLARTQWTRYYLHSGGRANSLFGDGSLSTQAAEGNEPADTYQYDPARPVPFISDETSSQIGGPDDYAAVERRDDVLVYVTEVLTQDVEVTGPIRLELYATSSAFDTDFTAKLIDVWPTGFRQRLCDGMVRARFRNGMDKPELIEPGKVYKYTIECWDTAQVFKAGHRIGLEVSSSAFPKFDRNLNTGAPLGKTSEFITAEQQIYHDAEHPSALILPIIPR